VFIYWYTRFQTQFHQQAEDIKIHVDAGEIAYIPSLEMRKSTSAAADDVRKEYNYSRLEV
jgi:hypothetical protein